MRQTYYFNKRKFQVTQRNIYISPTISYKYWGLQIMKDIYFDLLVLYLLFLIILIYLYNCVKLYIKDRWTNTNNNTYDTFRFYIFTVLLNKEGLKKKMWLPWKSDGCTLGNPETSSHMYVCMYIKFNLGINEKKTLRNFRLVLERNI